MVESSSLLRIEEEDLSDIGMSLIDNSKSRKYGGSNLFGAKKLFDEYYEKVDWNPKVSITDSNQLEHYKLESPYYPQIEEFERKSAVNKGRELPTLAGWASGIPAAVVRESAILAGGGIGFLLGYTISKARASRYEARSMGIEKKLEDIIYRELAEKHLEDFKDYEIEILDG